MYTPLNLRCFGVLVLKHAMLVLLVNVFVLPLTLRQVVTTSSYVFSIVV